VARWSILHCENTLNLIKKSPEVYLAPGPIASIGQEEVGFLRRELAQSPRRRLRINTHLDNADPLHEMFIAIHPDSYIRPHKHLDKSEAFHIVYGEVDIVVFEDDGRIRQIVPLAAGDDRKAFYYRMSAPYLHTLVIRSDVLVVHEITNGPFVKDATVFGAFAPADDAGPHAIAQWRVTLAAWMAEASQ
jgi:cupin fold WbuC family metalloprotein